MSPSMKGRLRSSCVSEKDAARALDDRALKGTSKNRGLNYNSPFLQISYQFY